MTSDSILDRKVKVLVKLRAYKRLETIESKEGQMFTVEGRKGKRYLLWSVPEVETVGIKYVNQLSDKVESLGLNGGILISNGKYTYSARSNSPKKKVELIPPNFPAFDIFEHHLVPKHEILSTEEKDQALKSYRVEPYQIPSMRTSDPIAKVIGVKAGDLVRIIRNSPTAGEHISYRYVIDG